MDSRRPKYVIYHASASETNSLNTIVDQGTETFSTATSVPFLTSSLLDERNLKIHNSPLVGNKTIIAVYIPYNASRNQNPLINTSDFKYIPEKYPEPTTDNIALPSRKGDKWFKTDSGTEVEIIKSIEVNHRYINDYSTRAKNPYVKDVVSMPELEASPNVEKDKPIKIIIPAHFLTSPNGEAKKQHAVIVKRQTKKEEAPTIVTKTSPKNSRKKQKHVKISFLDRGASQKQQKTKSFPSSTEIVSNRNESTRSTTRGINNKTPVTTPRTQNNWTRNRKINTRRRQNPRNRKSQTISSTPASIRKDESTKVITQKETTRQTTSTKRVRQQVNKTNDIPKPMKTQSRRKQVTNVRKSEISKNKIVNETIAEAATNHVVYSVATTTTTKGIKKEDSRDISRKRNTERLNKIAVTTRRKELQNARTENPIVDNFDLISRLFLSNKLLRKPQQRSGSIDLKHSRNMFSNVKVLTSAQNIKKSDRRHDRQQNLALFLRQEWPIKSTTEERGISSISLRKNEKQVTNNIRLVSEVESKKKLPVNSKKNRQKLRSLASHWDFGKKLRSDSSQFTLKNEDALKYYEQQILTELPLKSKYMSSYQRASAYRTSKDKRKEEVKKENNFHDHDEVLLALSDKVAPTTTFPLVQGAVESTEIFPSSISLEPHSKEHVICTTTIPPTRKPHNFRPSQLLSMSIVPLTQSLHATENWRHDARDKSKQSIYEHPIHKEEKKEQTLKRPTRSTSGPPMSHRIMYFPKKYPQQQKHRRQSHFPPQMQVIRIREVPMTHVHVHPVAMMRMMHVHEREMKMIQIQRSPMGMMHVKQSPMKMIKIQQMPMRLMKVMRHPMKMIHVEPMGFLDTYMRRDAKRRIQMAQQYMKLLKPRYMRKATVHQYPRR